MTALVDIVMFGWIPVVLLLCAILPTRRAVVASFVIAWSFLPMMSYHIQGLPAYSKMSATCGGVLLGALFFDIGKLLAFRPKLVDLPMAIWCLCPCASSLANGLGLYDGVSAAFAQTVTWGFPYFIGRLYLGDRAGLKELASGILMGGLLYVPLCLFENRMSPQLHKLVYGYHAVNDFGQTMRFGGWRPTVFMDHGLMVGMWMSMAALIGIWLWWTRALRDVWGIPMWLIALGLLGTAILCKSMGALVLLAAGIGVLACIKLFHARWIVWILIAIAPVYVCLRITKTWDGSEILQMTQMVSADRSQSMEFRFFNENLLVDKAMIQPIFGWGGWGRSQIIDTKNNFRTVVDGEWINALGLYGMVGLVSFSLVLLLPAALFMRRLPAAGWSSPTFAASSGLLMINVLYMIDNIPNAMVNPVYVLAAGGLTGILAYKPPVVVPFQNSSPELSRRGRSVAVHSGALFS